MLFGLEAHPRAHENDSRRGGEGRSPVPDFRLTSADDRQVAPSTSAIFGVDCGLRGVFLFFNDGDGLN
jgi:hypothetical protein